MTGNNEIRVTAEADGTKMEATASLGPGEKLHVERSLLGGWIFYVSNGGEVCKTPQEAKDLERDGGR